jgi:hypothetical protein
MRLRCSGGTLNGQMVEVQDNAQKGDFVPVEGKVAGKPVDAAYEVVSDERGRMWLVAPVTTKED